MPCAVSLRSRRLCAAVNVVNFNLAVPHGNFKFVEFLGSRHQVALMTSLLCSGRPSVSTAFSTWPRPPSGAPRKATRPTTSNGWPGTVTRSRWRSRASRRMKSRSSLHTSSTPFRSSNCSPKPASLSQVARRCSVFNSLRHTPAVEGSRASRSARP